MARGIPRSLARSSGLRRSFVVRGTVTITVDGSSGAGFGTAVLGRLPEGNLSFHAAVAYFSVLSAGTPVSATFSGDVGIGTTATADATLGTTDVNVIGSTAIGPAVAGVIAATRGTGTTYALIDNTAGTTNLNINLSVDDADVSGTTGTVTIEVVVYLDMVVLGDD